MQTFVHSAIVLYRFHPILLYKNAIQSQYPCIGLCCFVCHHCFECSFA